MGRPRQFDSDTAIEQAMRLFWTKGYNNTGLRDLLKAMKIGEGSFYNLLSRKERVVLALSRPLQRSGYKAPAGDSGFDAVNTGRDTEVFRRGDRGVQRSRESTRSLMANSLFADVLVDPDLRATVEREFRAFEQYLADRLTRAVKAGELPKGFPVQSTAGILITFLQGFFRMYGSLHDKRAVKRQIDQLLADLNLGASPTRLNARARPTSPASRRASARSRAYDSKSVCT
jgi:TetR/AcrR family transcriptional repressor of nem operon